MRWVGRSNWLVSQLKLVFLFFIQRESPLLPPVTSCASIRISRELDTPEIRCGGPRRDHDMGALWSGGIRAPSAGTGAVSEPAALTVERCDLPTALDDVCRAETRVQAS